MAKKSILADVKQVTLPDDFEEVVDALNSADGWAERVVLYCDRELRKVLEHMKYANLNIRGSYGGGEKLKNLYRKKGFLAVRDAVIKYCKKHNIKVLQTRVSYHYEEV